MAEGTDIVRREFVVAQILAVMLGCLEQVGIATSLKVHIAEDYIYRHKNLLGVDSFSLTPVGRTDREVVATEGRNVTTREFLQRRSEGLYYLREVLLLEVVFVNL